MFRLHNVVEFVWQFAQLTPVRLLLILVVALGFEGRGFKRTFGRIVDEQQIAQKKSLPFLIKLELQCSHFTSVTLDVSYETILLLE